MELTVEGRDDLPVRLDPTSRDLLKPGQLYLDDGRTLEAEAFFVSSPAIGRTDLAQQLGVEMAHTGNHAQPASQRGDTDVPGVWIAGDLRPMTQQVSVAMGTGNVAAVMIDQSLRKRDVQT